MKILITSSFIPTEGLYVIKKKDVEEVKTLLEVFKKVEVVTQHQTVKILGIEPAKDRISLTEEDVKNNIQIWIKPKKRLEFGKEYSIDEIEEIGYDIFVAMPWNDFKGI